MSISAVSMSSLRVGTSNIFNTLKAQTQVRCFSNFVKMPVPHYAECLKENRILTRIDLNNLPPPARYGGPLRAITFDKSGSVVNSGLMEVKAAIKKVFQTGAKIDATDEEIARDMSIRKDLHLQAMLLIAALKKRWKEVHGKEPTVKDGKKLFKLYPDIQMKILRDKEFRVPITGLKELMINITIKDMKTISTTGFLTAQDIFLNQALGDQNYDPDVSIDASQVPNGRPTGEEILLGLAALNIAPSFNAKVGDANGDMWEAHNAHGWAIAVALTSIYGQHSEAELSRLPSKRIMEIHSNSVKTLAASQPHFICDGLWSVWDTILHIDQLTKKGFHPFHFPVINNHKKPLTLYKQAFIPS